MRGQPSKSIKKRRKIKSVMINRHFLKKKNFSLWNKVQAKILNLYDSEETKQSQWLIQQQLPQISLTVTKEDSNGHYETQTVWSKFVL